MVDVEQHPTDRVEPCWRPTPEIIEHANLTRLIREKQFRNYREFHAWSARERDAFWGEMAGHLGIRFDHPPERIRNPDSPVWEPEWFPGARLNIINSCFRAPNHHPAILSRSPGSDEIHTTTYGQLKTRSYRVARALQNMGLQPGCRIAIDMPMTPESVEIYLGIIAMGGSAVSIADSFAAPEIETRLRISDAHAVFTQDVVLRDNKKLPLYDKVCQAHAPTTVVLAARSPEAMPDTSLRPDDMAWPDFLAQAGETPFSPVSRRVDDEINVIFSSGTTGDPKAIPWSQITPLKGATDAFLHHDIHPGDRLIWPTNIGWMMGPWLIFASLLNRATMGLYQGLPHTRGFGEFVQDSKATFLGVIPSLVKTWKSSGCMEGLDWSNLHCFSSTGECSNPTEMLYLMGLTKGRAPVIEYCGGTELGGGYIANTMVEPILPSAFSTPTCGLDLVLLEDEAFLVPPSVGFSSRLLNGDNFQVYYADTPQGPGGEPLRRHGDRLQRLENGYFRVGGRADDTMNLGGIKTGSAEIERVLNNLPEIRETAAVAVSPEGGGPELLVIFAVPEPGDRLDGVAMKAAFQQAIRSELNPLFKIHDVVVVESLPRTASNKVMRRKLREAYRPPD